MLANTANPTQARDSALSLALIVAVLTVLAVAVPFAALVAAPALLIIGLRTVRRSEPGTIRTIGWLAVSVGVAVIVLTLFVVFGLMAWSGGVVVDSAPVPAESL